MTPAARISAAIQVLDWVFSGAPVEVALTNWGRASRYAGSGDRHAVRDLVFDALRCKRSYAALGGAETGRGVMLGALRAKGIDADQVFTGEGHAPAPVAADEAGRTPIGAEALDIPDWIYPLFHNALGVELDSTLQAMRQRAPVFLRVNVAKTTLAKAQSALAAEGIMTRPVDIAKNGLEVIENERKISTSQAYLTGLVELQDASSQAVVEAVPLTDGLRVLDLCAGGGGKTLALAARAKLQLFAHDHDPRRMRDLPDRAKRAGAQVSIMDSPEKSAPYDAVLTDVPCSGSGSWRRDPQGKWALTQDQLAMLCATQAQILDRAAAMVKPGGLLAYATCSMLVEENEDQIVAFQSRKNGWQAIEIKRFSPVCGGDGFFLCIMRASQAV